MRGADYIIKAIQAAGVDTIFGYPGGAIMPVYDALVAHDGGQKIRHILCRHEQGAALAAEGYARSSGKVGVCIATSGPGATNLMTGIANAYMDSIPLVAITGQVASPLIGTDAFQEVDVFGMTLSVVKHSFLVQNIEDLAEVMTQAFSIATSGRPGPVLIDIPKDIQLAEFEFENNAATVVDFSTATTEIINEELLELAVARIKNSEKPLIYAGGGVVLASATDDFRAFCHATEIPVVTTLKGIGTLTYDDPLNLGMLGMHGTKAANYAVHECDLLIAIGVRFDDRATGKLAEFAPNAGIIHLDIDRAEIGKLKRANISLPGELAPKLNYFSKNLSSLYISNWKKRCRNNADKFAWDYDAPIEGIYAPFLINELSKQAEQNTVISCDVGQHQMWVAQHYGFTHPNNHLSSGGLGTMGYGLPAALGAQFAHPDAMVINISGDGSFMMNIQELATIKRYNLPIKIIIIDNQRLGMVKQWQELFFEERYSEVDLSDNPDFVKIAKAFEIEAMTISSKKQIQKGLNNLLKSTSAFLLHVQINSQENVWPLVPPGLNNSQMMEGAAQ
ncbi:MAG TPA: acetolactate synthase 2 catalytic subunit [Aeromonadales bacterium]|nr:acetolactate synthase 2 catalytic subunit [Aeromonadales bacterium]